MRFGPASRFLKVPMWGKGRHTMGVRVGGQHSGLLNTRGSTVSAFGGKKQTTKTKTLRVLSTKRVNRV